MLEVPSEVVEVQNINTSATTSQLPGNARSQALTKISTVPLEGEVLLGARQKFCGSEAPKLTGGVIPNFARCVSGLLNHL